MHFFVSITVSQDYCLYYLFALTINVSSLYFLHQATEFVERLGGHRSVYGYHSDTLKSLLISILPPVGYKIDDNFKTDGKCSQSTEVYFLESLLSGLRDNAGFRIPMVSAVDVCIPAFTVLKHLIRVITSSHATSTFSPIYIRAVPSRGAGGAVAPPVPPSPLF